MSTPETPQVSGLVEQLKAAIDEDERIALDAGATAPHWGEGGNPYLYAAETVDARSDWCLAKFGVGNPVFGDPMAQVTHAARHNPARTLAMVAAHRALIDEILALQAKIDDEWGCCHSAEQIARNECHTKVEEIDALVLLAKGYGIQA